MTASEALFVGIDVGTSSVRCQIINQQGQSMAASKVSMPAPLHPASGHYEQDPQLWNAAMDAALEDVFRQIDPTQVKAVCLDATSSTVLLSDQQLNPLGNALMYNDSRAVEEVVEIRRHAPAKHLCSSPSSSLSKALWLLKQYPQNKGALIMHQADWLNARLVGQPCASDPNNTLKLGYDPEHLYWPHWLSHFSHDLASRLPDVVTSGSLLGYINPQICDRYHLAADTAVYAGTTDSTASSLATGIHELGDAVTTLGTTMTVKVITARPLESLEYGVYSHLLPNGLWLTGGASNVGGKVLEQLFSAQQIQKLSQQLDCTTLTGLNYYPLPDTGERFPINDPLMPARLTPRPDDDRIFLQGIFEGIARVEQLAYATLAELGATLPLEIVTAGGGAAQNDHFRQLREKIIGLPIRSAPQTEAAFGVAGIARDAYLKQKKAG